MVPPPLAALRGGWGFVSLHILLKGTQRSGFIGERPKITSNAGLTLYWGGGLEMVRGGSGKRGCCPQPLWWVC